jgi:hypothetical protein
MPTIRIAPEAAPNQVVRMTKLSIQGHWQDQGQELEINKPNRTLGDTGRRVASSLIYGVPGTTGMEAFPRSVRTAARVVLTRRYPPESLPRTALESFVNALTRHDVRAPMGTHHRGTTGRDSPREARSDSGRDAPTGVESMVNAKKKKKKRARHTLTRVTCPTSLAERTAGRCQDSLALPCAPAYHPIPESSSLTPMTSISAYGAGTSL